jgi:hypothetical protein
MFRDYRHPGLDRSTLTALGGDLDVRGSYRPRQAAWLPIRPPGEYYLTVPARQGENYAFRRMVDSASSQASQVDRCLLFGICGKLKSFRKGLWTGAGAEVSSELLKACWLAKSGIGAV